MDLGMVRWPVVVYMVYEGAIVSGGTVHYLGIPMTRHEGGQCRIRSNQQVIIEITQYNRRLIRGCNLA